MNEHQNAEKNKIITKKDLMKVFWRSFLHECSFNYERYQALGISYAMTPILKKLYGNNKEKMAEACLRHIELYNSPVQIANFTVGLCIALEEKNYSGEEDMGPVISSLKTALMGPLSAIGDTLFWGVFRIVAASIGASMLMQGNPLGIVFFIVLFNLPHIFLRYFTLFWSYRLGDNFMESLSGGVVGKITECAYLIGQMVVGAMAATFITIKMPMDIKIGEASINIQEDILDAIFPNLLPLLATLLCAWLLRKKNVSPIIIILLILAIGIAGGAFGLLGS